MLTPRPHLSWSQLDLFERNPEKYRALYVQNDPEAAIPVNRGMALGKSVANALETGEETGDLKKDFVIAQLPKFEVMEYELRVTIDVGGIKIPLLIKMDSAMKTLEAFKEYKTGTTAWNKEKANKHGQMIFYATGIYSKVGKIPAAELVWAPCEKDDSGRPYLTGEIRRFEVKVTMADILKMKIRMKNAWLGIQAMVEEELI